MPQPGQKSVTLPAELVARAAAAAEPLGLSASRFIARAVEGALDGDAAPADPPARSSAPVNPPASGGAEPAGEATHARTRATSDVHDHEPRQEAAAKAVGIPDPRPVARPDGAQVQGPPTSADAASALPSPPSTSGAPSPDAARGPGDARPSTPLSSSAPKGGRSPRLEPDAVVLSPQEAASSVEPGAHAVPGVPPATAASPAPARGVPEISMWTCGRCHVTIPLLERWDHRCPVPKPAPKVLEADTPAMVLAGGGETTGTPSPRRKQPDVDRVVRFVKMFLHGAKEATDRRVYLVAAVQEAHRDQGIVISKDEAAEVLTAIATRDSAIERALEPPMSLDPHVSKSTTPPAKARGERGR